MALTKKIKRFEADWEEDVHDPKPIYMSIADGFTHTGEWFSIKDARKIIKKIEKAIAKAEQKESK